ncbi:NAD(P)/FAD-dependent oxidoreductase [Asticcacaulis excentricus]|uniref:HI0933 family protein n=1 Tax=Asticcacaulis excentricus (strain ATCC 15261 / DSM 4724 / KCTC 12464 / NCIMB 9791 / VKM B-1370 / CB 48) TaxID=573065 RepID=E8RT02_ASTEC|nr:NAD(P)/FAD-dependent oxidoreductase [Asticcacaulis excentricus]ADU14623.1 HI0933 family protein [Asticcacaulis excentricus CB 48]
MRSFDAVIIGAGAAGLMCGIEAAKRGRKVVVIDHARAPAEKIRISGGGRCNFTHLEAAPKHYLSQNPHFCKSALKRFGPWDFLDRVIAHHIPYHHKTEGQLFCDNSAKDIIDMLLGDLRAHGGELWLQSPVQGLDQTPQGFRLSLPDGVIETTKLVLATGGLSIPKMGATGFAYEVAQRFGHGLITPRAGLVPFTLGGQKLDYISGLSGVSLQARARIGKTMFEDGFLFTHRGLSGPAMLQISSFWTPGQTVEIDLLPGTDALAVLKERRQSTPRQHIGNVLPDLVPTRLSERILEVTIIAPETRIADLSDKRLSALTALMQPWALIPDGTEGYRTAEVTVGGVDTTQVSSQTMESQLCPGLFIIGEALDVTGWLGGYNFQWAWSSGWAAGQAL